MSRAILHAREEAAKKTQEVETERGRRKQILCTGARDWREEEEEEGRTAGDGVRSLRGARGNFA